MMPFATAGRLIFGASMLLGGANHFLGLYPAAAGQAPLAAQLMGAFTHSGLLDVAMAVQLVAGALLLAGVFVPVALAVLMPISVCALYWVLGLERDLIGSVLVLAAFGLNGLLMLAYLDYYRPMLVRRALAVGETP